MRRQPETNRAAGQGRLGSSNELGSCSHKAYPQSAQRGNAQPMCHWGRKGNRTILILADGTHRILTVLQKSGRFTAYLIDTAHGAPLPVRHIPWFGSLDEVQGKCEVLADMGFGINRLGRSDQSWRSLPPTDRQLHQMRKFGLMPWREKTRGTVADELAFAGVDGLMRDYFAKRTR